MLVALFLWACAQSGSGLEDTGSLSENLPLLEVEGQISCLDQVELADGDVQSFKASLFLHFNVAEHEVCELDGFSYTCSTETTDEVKIDVPFDPDSSTGDFYLTNVDTGATVLDALDHRSSSTPTIYELSIYLNQTVTSSSANNRYERVGEFRLSDLPASEQDQILSELNETYARMAQGIETSPVSLNLGSLTGLCP